MQKNKIRKYALLVFCLLAAMCGLLASGGLSVETLLEYTPKEPEKAFFLFLFLYALKSATIFFPLIILEIASGYLFPTWAALLLNFTGILLILTIPYWMGKSLGLKTVQKATQKYPRFETIIDKQQSNSLFLCFFLRVISCLPGDLVTMYFGATGTPFWQNLLGGVLGIIPRMVLATLMGSSIQEPSSPIFWISALLTVTLSVLSAALYYVYQRRFSRRSPEDDPKKRDER